MSENGEEAKRTRTMGAIKVEILNGLRTPEGSWSSATPEAFKTIADAEKWIQSNAANETTHRIIREVCVVKVKVAQIRQAQLEFGQ